jgi:hypothetical protein
MDNIFLNKFYESENCELLSCMSIGDNLMPEDFLPNGDLHKSFNPVFYDVKNLDNVHVYNECIFKHVSGFYFHLSRDTHSMVPTYTTKILFKVSQYEEVKVFITRLRRVLKR